MAEDYDQNAKSKEEKYTSLKDENENVNSQSNKLENSLKSEHLEAFNRGNSEEFNFEDFNISKVIAQKNNSSNPNPNLPPRLQLMETIIHGSKIGIRTKNGC